MASSRDEWTHALATIRSLAESDASPIGVADELQAIVDRMRHAQPAAIRPSLPTPHAKSIRRDVKAATFRVTLNVECPSRSPPGSAWN